VKRNPKIRINKEEKRAGGRLLYVFLLEREKKIGINYTNKDIIFGLLCRICSFVLTKLSR
jgi:hypothetical protein